MASFGLGIYFWSKCDAAIKKLDTRRKWVAYFAGALWPALMVRPSLLGSEEAQKYYARLVLCALTFIGAATLLGLTMRAIHP